MLYWLKYVRNGGSVNFYNIELDLKRGTWWAARTVRCEWWRRSSTTSPAWALAFQSPRMRRPRRWARVKTPWVNFMRKKLRGKLHLAEFLNTLIETCFFTSWKETNAQHKPKLLAHFVKFQLQYRAFGRSTSSWSCPPWTGYWQTTTAKSIKKNFYSFYRHTLTEGEELRGVADRRVRRVQKHLVDGLAADVGGDDDDGAVAGSILVEGLNEFREVQGHGGWHGVGFDVLQNDLQIFRGQCWAIFSMAGIFDIQGPII